MTTPNTPRKSSQLARSKRSFDHSRVMRALTRYLLLRGTLSAGGVTISALVSLTAALTIAVNVFRLVLGSRPSLFERVVNAVNSTFPGLLATGTNEGIIQPDALLVDRGFTVATVISIPVLAWTATNVMTGLRLSIRAMFGLTGAPLNPIRGKIWDAVGVLLFATAVLTTALLSSISTIATRELLDAVGIQGGTLAIRVAALAVAFLVDALTIVVLFRVAAKVRIPRRNLLLGAVIGALGWGVLRVAGTSVIGQWDSPLIASFAALATLIIWINLAVRWCLLTAAWTSDPPFTPLSVLPEEVHDRETPNYVTMAAPHTLLWPHHHVTGTLMPATAGVSNATGSRRAESGSPAEAHQGREAPAVPAGSTRWEEEGESA